MARKPNRGNGPDMRGLTTLALCSGGARAAT